MTPECVITMRERPQKWSVADVSLAEIAAASVMVLEKQSSTPKVDLICQTCIVLRFKVTAAVREWVAKGVDLVVSSGRIVLGGGLCKSA